MQLFSSVANLKPTVVSWFSGHWQNSIWEGLEAGHQASPALLQFQFVQMAEQLTGEVHAESEVSKTEEAEEEC